MIQNINEIKEQLDIIEIISTFLPLKRSGSNYTAKCPFHEEKSDSFIVSKSKNRYKCFGCGAGGNAIDFIMNFLKIDFTEAILKAAEISNIEIKQEYNAKYAEFAKKKQEAQERLEILNKEQLKALIKHEKLMEYLLKRGLTYENIERHDLGYNLDSKIILDIMGERLAKELYLITENGYNFFNNRLMFGIRDSKNKLVGYSGRIHDFLNFSKQAKYINSKDSFLYKKSDILYNINHAKKLINETKSLYIVEGYFDSITCNILNTPSIALCGTALNENHIKNIAKYTNDKTTINIMLDSDKAGRAASVRAYKTFMQYNYIDIVMVRLQPRFKDLNEFYIAKQRGETKDSDQNAIKHVGLEFCLKVELGLAESIKEKQEKLRFYTEYYKKADYFTKEYMLPYLSKYQHLNAPQRAPTDYNKSEQDYILTLLANDANKAFLARHVLDSSDFIDSKSFLDIYNNIDTKYHFIETNNDISNDDFYKIILRYKIYSLESKRAKALQRRPIDTNYILLLNKEIKEFKSELVIPF